MLSAKGTVTSSERRIHKVRLRERETTECVLMSLGMVLLTFYAAARIQGALLSQLAAQMFDAPQGLSSRPKNPGYSANSLPVDFRLWSQHQISAYKQMLARHFEPPLALLRIRRIALEAPVLDATDDISLNRGVGWIRGTERPGKLGNVGIAGHRDSFFRGLKDLRIGDTMELVTRDQDQTFVVNEMQVVNPDDVGVLKPRDTATLTLVTCYPFYFVGSAPQRYIIHASIIQSQQQSKDDIEGIFPE